MKFWNGKVFPTIGEHMGVGRYGELGECVFSNAHGMVFNDASQKGTQQYVSSNEFWDQHTYHRYRFKVIQSKNSTIDYKELNDELNNKIMEQEKQIYNYVENAVKAEKLALVNNAQINILRHQLANKGVL
jgi:hypothetical protein